MVEYLLELLARLNKGRKRIHFLVKPCTVGLDTIKSGVDLALESFGDMPRGDALFLVGMGTGFCKDSATFLSADVTRLYVRGLFSLFPVPPCCL